MKIKLPKDLRGFAYDRVMPVDFNTFDVELLLPAVFFKVVTAGQSWGRHANDPTKIGEYVARLAQHDDIAGFDDGRARRLLDRLTRTSLVQVGRKGASRTIVQIEGVVPYTILAFKPEFPSEHSRLRRVDALVYRMLRDQFRQDDGALRTFFLNTFGRGVSLRGGPEPDGWYDGKTDLDTMSRLSLALIDGFASTGIRKAKERPAREACPAIADSMARDLRRYLEAYRDRMPIEALTYHLKALINAELFVYSLKLFYAVIDLVDNPADLPPAMNRRPQPSSPDVYLDFTGSPGPSREMASGCVRRDLEAIQRFIQANLTLRQLDRYVHQLRGDRRVGAAVSAALADDEGGPEYLQALLGLLNEPTVHLRIEAAAQHDEEAIRREHTTEHEDEDAEPNAELAALDAIAESAESDFERLVLLMTEGLRTKTAQNTAAWYWSVGGLTKPYGILNGTLKGRQNWRYAPSNDLLATLVMLAAVDIPKWDKDDPGPQPIHLREFLHWLEERFGMIVDRPPAGYDGAEYVAAAQENLRAMLRRLQQMGVFRDLSDDFTVQRLTPPYADAS